MGQQLVATQESFARISEEAAGRLQAISGKVVASEANVNNGSEALKLQISSWKPSCRSRASNSWASRAGHRTDSRLAQMSASTTELTAANTKLQGQVQALTDAVASLTAAQAEVKGLATDVAALKKQGNPSAAIARLEQDLLVLKSAQENQPANVDAPTNKEFDVFRIQTTRNITTLQSQVQNLNQRLMRRLRPHRWANDRKSSSVGASLLAKTLTITRVSWISVALVIFREQARSYIRLGVDCHHLVTFAIPFVTCPSHALV